RTIEPYQSTTVPKTSKARTAGRDAASVVDRCGSGSRPVVGCAAALGWAGSWFIVESEREAPSISNGVLARRPDDAGMKKGPLSQAPGIDGARRCRPAWHDAGLGFLLLSFLLLRKLPRASWRSRAGTR